MLLGRSITGIVEGNTVPQVFIPKLITLWRQGMFPFDKLLPSHMIAILSLVLLAIACIALYGMKLSGAWRAIYLITAIASLYLNVFVLVIQSFLKIGPLHALAPSVPPSEPPFAVTQGVVLVLFVIAIIAAVRRFRLA